MKKLVLIALCVAVPMVGFAQKSKKKKIKFNTNSII